MFDYARSGPHFGAAELVIGATLAPVMGGFTGNTGTIIHMITHTRVCDYGIGHHYSSILSVRTRAVVIINASSAIARSRTQTTSGLRAVRTAAAVSEQTDRRLIRERTRVAWPRIGALTDERSTIRLRRRATPAVAASRARVELIAHAPCELGEWGCHRLEGWTSASSNEPSGPTMWKRSE